MINTLKYNLLNKEIHILKDQFDKIINNPKFINKKNKIDNLLNLYTIIIKMRLLHGKLLDKLIKYSNKKDSIKKYFSLSMYDSISFDIKSIINDTENNYKKLYDDIPDLDKLVISKLSDKEFQYIINNSIFNDTEDELSLDTSYNKVIDESIYTDRLNDNKSYKKLKNNSIIYFYLSTCSHCVEFKPIWDGLIKYFDNTNINFIKIKCDNYNNEKIDKLIKIFNVEGFPSIYLKKKSKIIPFIGNRDPTSLVDFVNDNNL